MDIPEKLNRTYGQKMKIEETKGKYSTTLGIATYNGGRMNLPVCLRCGNVVGDGAEDIHDKSHEED